MGVPAFYRTTIQKYHKIIKKTHDFNGPKHLYFDYNALIHPASAKAVSEYKGNDYVELELLIITAIIKYTDEIKVSQKTLCFHAPLRKLLET